MKRIVRIFTTPWTIFVASIVLTTFPLFTTGFSYIELSLIVLGYLLQAVWYFLCVDHCRLCIQDILRVDRAIKCSALQEQAWDQMDFPTAAIYSAKYVDLARNRVPVQKSPLYRSFSRLSKKGRDRARSN